MKYALGVAGLGLLIVGIVLWRRIGKIEWSVLREWDRNR